MTTDYVVGVVEGSVDETILGRLLDQTGKKLVTAYVQGGKGRLLQKLNGYNSAAQVSPWVVLVDLDRDYECPPPALAQWLPAPARKMCFRIAVRSAEAWLMADRARFAKFLGVPQSSVAVYPEQLDDPKGAVVELARASSKASIREGMVPPEGSGRRVGPLYPSLLIDFARSKWDPEEAAGRSDSLDRCLRRLVELDS